MDTAPGNASGRSGHCTPIHGLSEDTRFRGRTCFKLLW